MPDDTDIDLFMQRLIATITGEGTRLMTQDPPRFLTALKRADVDYHLRRLSELARDMSAFPHPVTHATPAATAPPVDTAALVPRPIAVAPPLALDPLADLTVQHLSTIREVVILLLAIETNGGATFAMVRAATSPFWKGEAEDGTREKALRTQLSRMSTDGYITTRGDGTYRVTDLGRKRLLERCDINSGLIRRVRPDIIEQAERLRRDGDLH